ncbi:MAG: zinc-ribbon domain-containing protein [Eubacterium sp.]|nr:zinc-ribbon domain-containing protein [Eubacterium sp.]MBR1674291.1 zinc-ribbon domain-containing protein [Eubacterium sp.]
MKNCPVCGAQLQDTDMVCPVCGAQQVVSQEGFDQAAQQVQQYVDPAMQQAQQYVDPAMQYQQDPYAQNQYGIDPNTQPQGMVPPAPKSGNGKKIAIIAGCAVAVIGILVAVYFLFIKGGSGADSPKAVAKKCVDALFDGDADEVYSCFPDGMLTSEEKESLKSALSYMQMFSSMITDVKAGSEKKLSGSEAQQYIDQIKSEYNIDVKEVASVPVTYTMEFMGAKETQTMDVICGKVGSKWYVIGGVN